MLSRAGATAKFIGVSHAKTLTRLPTLNLAPSVPKTTPRTYYSSHSTTTQAANSQNQQQQQQLIISENRNKKHEKSGNKEVNEWLQLIKNENISMAIQNYKKLKSSQDLTYSSLHQFIVMLCKHRPSADSALSSHTLLELVESTLNEMSKKHFQLNQNLYPVLLHFFVTLGKYQKARDLYQQMLQQKIPLTPESQVSMLICFQKLGELDQCLLLFENISNPALKYGNYLAERTMIRVRGQQGKLLEARQLRDALLSKLPKENSHLEQMVHLSYLDACADAKQPNSFLVALDEMKLHLGAKWSAEVYNHILIDAAKLSCWEEMLYFMNQHFEETPVFAGTVHANLTHPLKDLLQEAVSVRKQLLSPTTYSDILFCLVKSLQSDPNEKEKLLLVAKSVYEAYQYEILQTFEKFHQLSNKISEYTKQAIIENLFKQRHAVSKYEKVPKDQLYQILVKNPSTFIAMATFYKEMGDQDGMIEVLRKGRNYVGYAEPQLRNLFGDNYKQVAKRFGLF